jgi:hypothetical protein
MIFNSHLIDDHVFALKESKNPLEQDPFLTSSALDSLIARGSRKARSVNAVCSSGDFHLVRKSKHAPFWQLTKDGKIERTYDPDDEPLTDVD